jgi:hypothetical protein
MTTIGKKRKVQDIEKPVALQSVAQPMSTAEICGQDGCILRETPPVQLVPSPWYESRVRISSTNFAMTI